MAHRLTKVVVTASLPVNEEFVEPMFEEELVVAARAFVDDSGAPAFASVVILDGLPEGDTGLLTIDLIPPDGS